MPETAGHYSTRPTAFGPLARAHEGAQGLLGQGERVQLRGANGYPARSRGDGAPSRPSYEGRGRGARGGARDREVPRPVGHGACPCLACKKLDTREAEQVSGGLRELPEAIDELLGQVSHLSEGAEA